MIAQNLLIVGLVGALLLEVLGSPVSFPTEGPQSQDVDYPTNEPDDPEGRFNHAHHREKKKRKRQRLACLFALQQQNNRYRRAAPPKGDGRTLYWGGWNHYDTDIHVYNGGYGGSRPSYAPGQAINPSNPSNPCQGLPLFSHGFPNLGNFPSLPNFSNIGNEIINVVNPGTSFPGSLPSTGSSSSSSGSGIKPNPGGGSGPDLGSGGPDLGSGGPSPGGGDGDGDNTNEDYDYSDGGSDSDGDTNRIKKRRRPSQASSFLQPVDRYLDQLLFRPIDRTFQRIVRWF